MRDATLPASPRPLPEGLDHTCPPPDAESRTRAGEGKHPSPDAEPYAQTGEGKLPPADAEDPPPPPPGPGHMPLFDHLRELRKRLLRAMLVVGAGFLLCYWQAPLIQAALQAPLLQVLKTLPQVTGKLMFTGLAEAFLVEVKVALAAGLIAAAPVVFYQLWAFAAPGLYPQEKRLLIPLALATGLFFAAGSCFGYFVVFPPAFKFFLSYNSEAVVSMPALGEYFDLCIQLLLAFGLIFELPILAFFLARLGVVTPALLKKARGYAYIGAFVVGAILTPPDVISQLLMAGPLLVLYELSIVIVKVFGRKREAA